MELTEKQKNCPYCHKKNKPFTRSLINTSSLSLVIKENVLDAAYCQTLTDNLKMAGHIFLLIIALCVVAY